VPHEGGLCVLIESGNALPLLCTDAFGSKVQLLGEPPQQATTTQDIVSKLVNDLPCVGAKPSALVDSAAAGCRTCGRSKRYAHLSATHARRARVAVRRRETSLRDLASHADVTD